MKFSISVLKKSLFLICVIMVSCNATTEKKQGRSKTNINKEWQYLENNTNSTAQALALASWQDINLPHTWNALDATDVTPGYRRSAGWYKKELNIPTVASNQIYQLYFEGVNITSEVYVNGKNVGGHIGGYIGFNIDITDAISQGNNTILVRLIMAIIQKLFHPKKAIFIFGGITRDVWLETFPKEHLSNLKVSTPNVTNNNANLLATLTINNLSDNSTIKAILIDKNGTEIQSQKLENINSNLEISFNDLKDIKLWDTDNPYLYTLKVQLLQNDTTIDEISESIGFRWFEFKDYGAFYLNGKRLLLRGTHRHEEHAGVGAAMSNAQHRADMELIKDMGANFVRLAHYPQDPEVYKACNELGLLVWDELHGAVEV
ncbi:glycoside hydrolase family 2 protein [Jejuia pallidilutea]|nr:glycoside hydrolase family 2 TIM barrel-domain containing protein [Jejuia pallidilutea]